MHRLGKRQLWQLDWLLILAVYALSVFGVLAVANATFRPEGVTEGLRDFLQNIGTYYGKLHMIWIASGTAFMIVSLVISYKVYGDLIQGIYWVVMGILLITAFMPAISGTSAWIQITQSRTVQPAELAKLALIVMLAKQLSRYENGIQKVKDLVYVLFYAAVPMGLILAQNEYGSALVMAFIVIVMLFVSGANIKLLVGLLSTGLLSLIPIYLILAEQGSFRIQRILSFLDQSKDLGDNWNVYYAKLAIGSGQISGKGLFTVGTLTALNFVPQNHTDFIFSVVGESMGLVGSLSLIALFMFLIYRELRLALIVQDAFGSYIIIGIVAMQFYHIMENIGMCIGLMPVTGIPLPFISYGGTSMLTNFLAIGLVLNVGLRRERNNPIA